MTQTNYPTAHLLQHEWRDFAGVGAAVLGVTVLGAKYDLGGHVKKVGGSGKARIGWENEDASREGGRWGDNLGDGGDV